MLTPFTNFTFDSKLNIYQALSKPLYIDFDRIEEARDNGKEASDGKKILDAYIGTQHYYILEDELVQTLKKKESMQSAMKEHTAAIVNLTRALRELRMNIPSSIRMHM